MRCTLDCCSRFRFRRIRVSRAEVAFFLVLQSKKRRREDIRNRGGFLYISSLPSPLPSPPLSFTKQPQKKAQTMQNNTAASYPAVASAPQPPQAHQIPMHTMPAGVGTVHRTPAAMPPPMQTVVPMPAVIPLHMPVHTAAAAAAPTVHHHHLLAPKQDCSCAWTTGVILLILSLVLVFTTTLGYASASHDSEFNCWERGDYEGLDGDNLLEWRCSLIVLLVSGVLVLLCALIACICLLCTYNKTSKATCLWITGLSLLTCIVCILIALFIFSTKPQHDDWMTYANPYWAWATVVIGTLLIVLTIICCVRVVHPESKAPLPGAHAVTDAVDEMSVIEDATPIA